MAMSASAVTAELQRKKNLGIAPTSAANQAQYNSLKPVTTAGATTKSIVQPPPTTGTMGTPAALKNTNTFGAASTPTTTSEKTTPSITPPKDPFGQYGGKDSYVASQLNRWNNAVNSNDTGLMDRLQTDAYRVGYDLPGANNYKKTDTGLGMGGTGLGENGLPSDLSWLGAGANSEIAEEIKAYQGRQEAARQAMLQGVDANNAYLAEQVAAMQQQRAVDQDSLQQQQNRFGGLYSGGLNYQGGQINSAYAQQQGNLSRDVAARNSALQQQYGAESQTIADQIAQLQASAPEIINEKIKNYMMDYANLYGTDPLSGKQTAAYQNQNFNQGQQSKQANLDAALAVGNQAGMILNPQTDWTGLMRQVQSGKAPLNLQGMGFQAQEQQRFIDNAFRDRQTEIENALNTGQLTLAQAQEARLALGQELDEAYRWAGLDWEMMNAGGAETKSTFTPNQVYSAIEQKYTNFFKPDKYGEIKMPTASDYEAMYQDVIRYGLPEAQENDILRGIGLSDSEIAALDKKYLSGNQ